MEPTITLDRRQVRQATGRSPRRTSGRSRPATPSARRPRCSTRPTGPGRPPAGRHLSQHHRQRGDGPRLRGRRARRPAGPLFYGSYPITPASDILHQLSTYKNFGVQTFQAEDEIAAIGSAIGASYGGALGHDRHVRPGHRPQVRGDEPGRDGRAAPGRDRRPAGRPIDGHADQDRAGRPAPGPVRPERRFADPGRRARRRRPTASTWPSRPSAWRSST